MRMIRRSARLSVPQLVRSSRLFVVPRSFARPSSMAPKRKAEDDSGTKKKAALNPALALDDNPEFDAAWTSVKPAMLVLAKPDHEGSRKVAAFDFDNTLVEWTKGWPLYSTSPSSWEFWNKSAPTMLKVGPAIAVMRAAVPESMGFLSICCACARICTSLLAHPVPRVRRTCEVALQYSCS
jgi:hypothetical protein